jgi:hypothetical protein
MKKENFERRGLNGNRVPNSGTQAEVAGKPQVTRDGLDGLGLGEENAETVLPDTGLEHLYQYRANSVARKTFMQVLAG